jgi:hypothetical protein
MDLFFDSIPLCENCEDLAGKFPEPSFLCLTFTQEPDFDYNPKMNKAIHECYWIFECDFSKKIQLGIRGDILYG